MRYGCVAVTLRTASRFGFFGHDVHASWADYGYTNEDQDWSVEDGILPRADSEEPAKAPEDEQASLEAESSVARMANALLRLGDNFPSLKRDESEDTSESTLMPSKEIREAQESLLSGILAPQMRSLDNTVSSNRPQKISLAMEDKTEKASINSKGADNLSDAQHDDASRVDDAAPASSMLPSWLNNLFAGVPAAVSSKFSQPPESKKEGPRMDKDDNHVMEDQELGNREKREEKKLSRDAEEKDHDQDEDQTPLTRSQHAGRSTSQAVLSQRDAGDEGVERGEEDWEDAVEDAESVGGSGEETVGARQYAGPGSWAMRSTEEGDNENEFLEDEQGVRPDFRPSFIMPGMGPRLHDKIRESGANEKAPEGHQDMSEPETVLRDEDDNNISGPEGEENYTDEDEKRDDPLDNTLQENPKVLAEQEKLLQLGRSIEEDWPTGSAQNGQNDFQKRIDQSRSSSSVTGESFYESKRAFPVQLYPMRLIQVEAENIFPKSKSKVLALLSHLGPNPQNLCPKAFPETDRRLLLAKDLDALHGRHKFISMEYDCAGFNNVRLAFELALNFALLTKRTLILPPSHDWYAGECPENGCSMLDVYDLPTLRKTYSVITAEEYLGYPVSHGEFAYIMRMKNKANGITDKMLRVSLFPSWNLARRQFLEHPSNRKLPSPFFNADVVHFPAKCSNEVDLPVRLFGQMEFFFRGVTDEQQKEMQTRLYHGFRFKQEIINLTADALEKMGVTKCGTYCAVHFRRGDFLWSDFYRFHGKEMDHPIRWYFKSIKSTCNRNEPLFILTNPEEDLSYFDELTHLFDVKFMTYPENIPDKQWYKVIDMLTGACARSFVGSPYSTFSTYIQYLRGYLEPFDTKINEEEYYLDNKDGHYFTDELVQFRKDTHMLNWASLFTSRWKDVDLLANEPPCRNSKKILSA